MTDPAYHAEHGGGVFVPAHGPHWAQGRIREAAIAAVLVFAGYYLGARAGLALTFHPSPISVLWPPNAILFAAMILMPARLWWLVAAAALPAHIASELHAGIPVAMVMSWYVSNVAEALLGATILRSLSGTSDPFTTSRGVVNFILAACTAALASSFLDAGFIRLNGWGTTPYWTLWADRTVSNIVASFVFVPAIVSVAHARSAFASRPLSELLDEHLLLYGSIAIVTLVAFNAGPLIDAPAAQVCLPIPFMLWAALQYGPTGASVSFTFVALITIWGVQHGTGALGSRSAAENADAVQLYLLCIGPTLMCLAAAIDERRDAYESMRMSEKRFDLVLEATHDVVYERDLSDGRMWWSRKGPMHFGYSRSDDLRDYSALEALLHPVDRARLASQHEEALGQGRNLWDAEFRLRQAGGKWSFVHEQGFIVRDAAGKPLQLIAALTDVTERRAIDELSMRLAHASRLTAMGELAASIAHEINQPMGAILTNVDAALILLASGQPYETEFGEILRDIREDNMRAAEIIRHIRSLARKQGFEIEDFDVNEIVGSTAKLAQPIARRRGATVVTACGHVPHVSADPIHVKQVLLNLMLNAMDAMAARPAGERTLAITTCASPAMDSVVVSVRDSGSGIAPDLAERIFDSFFTTKADGMGLGLSIARSLVVAQGGRIWAENNPDCGATFSFTLPVNPR